MMRIGLIVAAIASWLGVNAHARSAEPPADIPVEVKIVPDEGLTAMQAWFAPEGIQQVNADGWAQGQFRMRMLMRPNKELFLDVTNTASWTVTGNGVSLIAPGVVQVAPSASALITATAGGHTAVYWINEEPFYAPDSDPPGPGPVISGQQIQTAVGTHVLPPLGQIGMPLGPWMAAAGAVTWYSNSGAAIAAGAPGSLWINPSNLGQFHVPGGWIRLSISSGNLVIRTSTATIVIRNDHAAQIVANEFTQPNGLYMQSGMTLWNELLHMLLHQAGIEPPEAVEEILTANVPMMISHVSRISNILSSGNVSIATLRSAVQSFQAAWRSLSEHPDPLVRQFWELLRDRMGWQDLDGNDVPDWLDRTLNPFFPNGIPKVWPQQ